MRGVIMVHDQDEPIMAVLKLALELEGFIVIPILNCKDSVMDIIDAHRPHVVILDVKLNNTDCIELCHRIKERYPHIPVLAISCNINIDSKYAQEGFDAYIRKPFDLALLYKVIRNLQQAGCRNLNNPSV